MKPSVLPGLFDVPTMAKPNAVKAERDRLNAAALRVLAFLQARGPAGALNHELCTPEVGGNRGIGRVDELREHYAIEKAHVSGGTWRYTYRGYR